ncbi:PREDICTED: testis-expressed sequence 2 protein-like [Camelina sativa]|uniref:Testis-expressed sequence 2 protein-like n=1 Tax=Camelina sativa TaxID=90675 RepID=A0ABM0VPU5_CAMSA|nr:PREDICTED: testis-expressed sequence 2 protein-like [Camelina sativa]
MFSFVCFVFLLSGFFLGILAVLAAEAAGFMYLLKRLNRKRDQIESKPGSDDDPTSTTNPPPRQPIDFSINKQGMVWILELDEVLKNWMMKEKLPKEHKKKRDFLEIHPLRKFARIKDHKLILSDHDGTLTIVSLKGCSIEAVSGSDLPTRKWAKRYPIKVESKISPDLYKGNQVFYIYLETSWEKESWCKALRLAACENQERFIWYSTKLKQDFRNYVTSLNVAYPSFMKPSLGFSFESLDRGNRTDGSSSKVRLFFRKFSRKRSHREDRKTYSQRGSSSGKSLSGKRMGDYITDETDVPIFSRSVSHSSHVSGVSDGDSEDKVDMDEGTLAWNLLISRLFFDLKRKTGVKNSVQARIQRVLSNMRTPSYIGALICSDVDTGNLPPHIHATRVLPMEMSGVWAFELDIEYSGEAVIDVETRVDIREVDLQKGITDTRLQTSYAGEVPSNFAVGVEDFEKQLAIPVKSVDAGGVKNGGASKADESKGSKGTKAGPNGVSRWKSILKTIAEQVSQVPISLSIRVSSLRGTLRVHMKPPPSDQLWFGFTSMPDIEFDLASSVGEHKITNSHVAMFLINRFKTAIREAVVLPNCESLTIPWMIAEKDDWVQRKTAPFMWLNQENDHNSSQATETRCKSDKPPTSSSCVQSEQMQRTASATQKPLISEAGAISSSSCAQSELVQKAATAFQKPNTEEAEAIMSTPSSNSSTVTLECDKTLEELRTPLLLSSSSEKQEMNSRGSTRESSAVQSPSRTIFSSEDDDSRGKKVGRRARMLDLGKKMGEKLEEKRRHMEEKSRQIVEKMRGPS